MDDISGIRDSPLILEGTFLKQRMTAWTYLGYTIQYQLFGMSPVAFHAVNWLLHTAVACVLFGFGRDFLRGQAPAGLALFGALLFAVHPLASEIPNYARTQDLAWVTLFSLLASWSLLSFLRDGGRLKLLGCALAICGATLSKGPGLFHALMMSSTIGLAFMTADHWRSIRRHQMSIVATLGLATTALWMSGILPKLLDATRLWSEPRLIGHAYTLARVFWEFAWRSVIPVALCADHQIAETLVPTGAHFWNIPDTIAIWAAAAMLALTLTSLLLARRENTRLLGICIFLYVSTILFRVTYLVPEFMPEYRIYPGMPWFCLGTAITLASTWRFLLGNISPRLPAATLVFVFAAMSAKRSLLWHDLDTLTADTLRQYPAQARAVWELQDRDTAAGRWQMVIDRQRKDWPRVFKHFMEANRSLGPRRELPSGHFAMADVACAGRFAEALAHVDGPAAGMAEIDRLEAYMRRLKMDPLEHQIHWNYFFRAKMRVLEQSGNPQDALDFMRRTGIERFHKTDIHRIENKLTPRS